MTNMHTDVIRTISPSEYFGSTPHRQLADAIIARSGEDDSTVGFIERVGDTWELTVYVARDPEPITKVVRVPVVGSE